MQGKPTSARLKLASAWRSLPAFTVAATVFIATVCLPSHPVFAQDQNALAIVLPANSETLIHTSSPGTAWTDNRCGSCHVINELFSHPINVIPSMSVPEGLPLEQGQMTCTTCHDDHVEAHTLARSTRTPMLRGTLSGSAFCAQCHDRMQSTRQSLHAIGLGKAHLAWPGKASGLAADPADKLDAETRSCLSCHDGIVSSDISQSGRSQFSALSEHPIGVSIAALQSDRPNANSMQYPLMFNGRIRLFNNRVGCNSCHSPFSREKKLLVMSNQRSQLCLSCHNP